MLHSLKAMKNKIASIEKHYGKEVMAKLKLLKQDIYSKIDGHSK